MKRIESSVLIAKMPLEDLDLSIRTYICLKRAGFAKIADLAAKTEDELMQVRNLGRKSFEEVKHKLDDLGIILRPSEVRFEDISLNRDDKDVIFIPREKVGENQ